MGITEWDRRFMRRAVVTASWSKDPKRKVGCTIVNQDKTELSGGYNGFPRGVKDDNRLDNTPIKLLIVVHAEANAVANAARNGHSLKGGIAYVTDHPCTQCASLLIQAGIRTVYYQGRYKTQEEQYNSDCKWADSWKLARDIFSEAGVVLIPMWEDTNESPKG